MRSRLQPTDRRNHWAALGLLPQALASIGLNGAPGNLLRAQMHRDQFEDLLIPMLAGALANVVKGMVNTALLRSQAGDAARDCACTRCALSVAG